MSVGSKSWMVLKIIDTYSITLEVVVNGQLTVLHASRSRGRSILHSQPYGKCRITKSLHPENGPISIAHLLLRPNRDHLGWS